jgi:hypothetical protein
LSQLTRRYAGARARGSCLIAAGVLGLVLVSSAGAATVTPSSNTSCAGHLTRDSSGASSGEPNLLDYTFQCDTPITAYTLVITRKAGDSNNIDDFSPTASVLEPDGVTPSSSVAFNCGGTIPGNGINCNAGAGGVTVANDFVTGSFDPIDQYCKNLPKNAKPGTLAEAQADVELVVSDNTGAEDGPFTLGLKPGCKAVPNVAPTPKPKPKPKKKSKKHASRHKAGRK